MYGGGFDGGGGFDMGMGGQFGNDQFGGAAFDANQFGGAAGFNPSQNGDGGYNVDNSGPDGKAKGSRDRQSLIPVTIKQLKNAPANAGGEQGFTVDGKDLYQVTVVGIIQSADEQTTNLQYTIDDGTDQITAKMWVDAEADDHFRARREQWREGVVVRVVGQLRVFNHVRSIVAFSITPITDFNEYSFHFIEVVHSHLRHTKGAPRAQVPGGAAPVNRMVGGGAMPTGQPGAAAGVFQPEAFVNGMTALQDAVLKYFQAYDSASGEQGCTVAQVTDAMASNGVTMLQVREAIDFLTGEGHLYSTIDDEHFKST